jgi:hypothetical protein
MLLWGLPKYGVKSEKHCSYRLAESAKCRNVKEGLSYTYIKKRPICVADKASKEMGFCINP